MRIYISKPVAGRFDVVVDGLQSAARFRAVHKGVAKADLGRVLRQECDEFYRRKQRVRDAINPIVE